MSANRLGHVGRTRTPVFLLVDEPDLAATSLELKVAVVPAKNVGDRQDAKGAFVPVGGAVTRSASPQTNYGGADGTTADSILAEYDPVGKKVYPLLDLQTRDGRSLPWEVGKDIQILADPTKPSKGHVIRGSRFGDAGFDAHVYIAGPAPGDAPIKLHHDTPNAPDFSTIAYEGDGSRPAKLSDALRIGAGVNVLCQDIPKYASQIDNGGPDWVFFNATVHGGARFSGFLATRFAEADAFLSHEAGGPLRQSSTLHNYAYTRDKRFLRRGALSISDHLWTDGNPRYDAPLWIEQVDEPDVMEPEGHAMRCHIQLDRKDKHKHLCKPGWKEGVFKVHKKEPIVETPPCKGSTQPGSIVPATGSSYGITTLMMSGFAPLSNPRA